MTKMVRYDALHDATPDQMGWELTKRLDDGALVYEKPDGTEHVFQQGEPQRMRTHIKVWAPEAREHR